MPLAGHEPNTTKHTSVRSLARGGDPTTNIDDGDDGGDEYDRKKGIDSYHPLLIYAVLYHYFPQDLHPDDSVMRESNFAFPAQNRACVCITSQLYDRRGVCPTFLDAIYKAYADDRPKLWIRMHLSLSTTLSRTLPT